MSRAGARKPTGTIAVTGQDTARYSPFAISLAQLRHPGWPVRGFFGYDTAYARHHLADTFEGDYLFFLDDDHTFPADTLERLLAHKVDIVAPLYLKRGRGFKPVARDLDGHTLRLEEPGLVEVQVTGTSGMLIHRRVFDKIGAPYFRAGQVEGAPHMVLEDTDFCLRARAAGFKVWCDTSIPFGHMAAATVLPVPTGDGWALSIVIGDAVVAIPYEQEGDT